MNTAQQAPLPASLPRPEAGMDLDARIQWAEQRVIARDERLRSRVSSLTQRARQALRPARLVAPALGGAVGLLALWGLLRGRRRTALAAEPRADRYARSVRSGRSPASAVGRVPWVRLLGLGWPLLPAAWRARVSPATASTLITLGLPLAERLLSKPEPDVPAPELPAVDWTRLSGVWHQQGWLGTAAPPGSAVTARLHITPQLDGSLEIVEQGRDAAGRIHARPGLARPLAGSAQARLRFSRWPELWRWLESAWQEVWVLHVDEDGSELLLGNAQRNALWLLSRRRRLPALRLQALVQIAQDHGYRVERVHHVVET
jgi:apolipoprotein D and lipocalin family protein